MKIKVHKVHNEVQVQNKVQKLRIALISSPFFGCPPAKYGGLEQVVYDLACGLDQLGHIVTLFAPEGSRKPEHGNLITIGKALDTVEIDWYQAEKNNYEIYKDLISPDLFDVVHGNGWFGFEYLLKTRYPNLKICHTHHGHYQWSTPPNPKPNLISISDFMKHCAEQHFQSKGYNTKSQFVYNGIDIDKYKFDPNIKKLNRLLYVGRFSKFKGPHTAIELAKKINIPLDLIGGSFVDDPNYMQEIESQCVNHSNMLYGDNIAMFKDASHEFKIRKMQEAKCLIAPSRMNEPFNLTIIEAMACGTAVIATNDGAQPELIVQNKTGYICENIDQMIGAIKNIDKILPEDCRKRAEEFSSINMAKNYENLYYKIMNGEDW